jgi:hypothetical protein
MRRCGSIFIFSLILVLTNQQAYAVRPLATEDATVLDPGAVELEYGFEYIRQNNSSDDYGFLLTPVVGIFKNFQISVEMPFAITDPDNETADGGIADIFLVGKTMFLDETEIMPSICLRSAMKFATGDEEKGLGTGDEDLGLVMAATKSIGKLTIDGNFGYRFVGDDYDETAKNQIVYGVALRYAINNKLELLSEVFADTEWDFDADSHTISPTIGLAYQVFENLRLDTNFRIFARDDQKTSYGVGCGMTLAF